MWTSRMDKFNVRGMFRETSSLPSGKAGQGGKGSSFNLRNEMEKSYIRWLIKFNKDHPSLVWSDKLLKWAFFAGWRAAKRDVYGSK